MTRTLAPATGGRTTRVRGIPARGPARRAVDDGGAAAVEFALIVPLLLALVFGIISFGLIFAASLGLNNATRQGARAAVVQDRTCAQIMAEFDEAVSGTLAMEYPIAVTISRAGGAGYAGVSCTASLAANHSVSYSAGSAGSVPCRGSGVGDDGTAYDQLILESTTSATVFVPPFIPTTAIDLDGKGVYRCEFS
jgi:Flp pilus assembly protein TadG